MVSGDRNLLIVRDDCDLSGDLRQFLGEREFAAWAKVASDRLLLRTPATMPSVGEAASQLRMAQCSLRRFDQEGTPFRALVDEVRQALAEELLVSEPMKLAEIASRLGYAEPAVFIAAFKCWHGVSPVRYGRSRSQA